MTAYELERAACAAAHEIYKLEHDAGRTATDSDDLDLVFASARRSRMLDRIVEAIKESFSVHVLASPLSGAPREAESVRHSRIPSLCSFDEVPIVDVRRFPTVADWIFTCRQTTREAQQQTAVEPSPSNEAATPTEANT
jgi:hypothetical protein